MADYRFLIALRFDAFATFTLAYTGARKLNSTITKALLMSSIIQNSVDNTSYVITDSDYKPYTLNSLKELGLKVITDVFDDILKKEYDSFIKSIDDLQLGDIQRLNKDQLMINISTALIKYNLTFLKSPDIDNIVRVILVNSEDLVDDDLVKQCYENTDNIPSYKSFQFIKYDKPYACFNYMENIIYKYFNIKEEERYYIILFEIFNNILNILCINKNIEKIYTTDSHYGIESTLEAFNEFTHLLEDIDILSYMDNINLVNASDCKWIKQYLVLKWRSLNHTCKKNCTPCILYSNRCKNQQLKEDLIFIFNSLLDDNLIKGSTKKMWISKLYNSKYNKEELYLRFNKQ